MTDLVSTIIPVYNRPTLLRQAVTSVLAQTYRPIEIIIVDDGSTDTTPEVILELEAAAPGVIHSLQQANAGPGVAREAGRQAAQGEFIQYLDSDDLLLPRKFEGQVAALREHPECGIAYGKTQFARVGQIPAGEAHKGTAERHEFLFPALLIERWWSTNTPLYRRSLCDHLGPWSKLWNEEDWEYEARAAAVGTKLCYCSEFVSVTRSHEPDQHLCYQSASDPRKLKDRAAAHALILAHAQRAGIDHEVLEMQHFARELFLLARQCGAAELAVEARELFQLARAASGPERAGGLDFRLYRLLAGMVGWARAGRLTCAMDRWRG